MPSLGTTLPAPHRFPRPPPPPTLGALQTLHFGDFMEAPSHRHEPSLTPFPDWALTRSQPVSSEQQTLLPPAKHNARFQEPVSGAGGQTNTCTSYYLTETISLVLPLRCFFFYRNFYFAKISKYTHTHLVFPSLFKSWHSIYIHFPHDFHLIQYPRNNFIPIDRNLSFLI